MNVSKDRVVRISCELRVSGGEVIESSNKTGPVEYKHGTGQMLSALESRLEGMVVGDEKTGTIPASEAFGADQPSMAIPKSNFPKDAKLEEGAKFEAKGPNGQPVTLTVTKIEDEQVIAKAVHPLADKDLEFTVKVLSVRPPPPPVPKVEEIDLVEEAD